VWCGVVWYKEGRELMTSWLGGSIGKANIDGMEGVLRPINPVGDNLSQSSREQSYSRPGA